MCDDYCLDYVNGIKQCQAVRNSAAIDLLHWKCTQEESGLVFRSELLVETFRRFMRNW
jgi:hypothetical protein